MAVDIIDGVEHRFAPNPKLQGEDWVKEYPPIKSNAKWLINKFTGEIVPNIKEFAKRSDILEPYLGDPSNETSAINEQVTENLQYADAQEVQDAGEELSTL